jgi:4-hydroxy-L-threonine phosphate dehydrogenase PdxA
MQSLGNSVVVYCTFRSSLRQSLARITTQRVSRVIATTDRTLRRLGIPEPVIQVGALNPHAGGGGALGHEESEVIGPAIDDARRTGICVTGPLPSDSMFLKSGVDAFIVMLHDHGQIAAELLTGHDPVALVIGSPILLSVVERKTRGAKIAGTGVADPAAIIEAITVVARAASV